MALDLTNLQTFHANKQFCISSSLGSLSETILISWSESVAISLSCNNNPPATLKSLGLLFCSPRTSVSNTLIFSLPDKIFWESSVTPGAMMTSTNWFAIILLAVASSKGLLKAIIPPKAEVSSEAKAFS